MVCIAWSVIISLILAVVWPVVQSGINAGKQVFGQDPLWLAWVTDLINYKDAGNMEAYKTLLTTVTPARFKVGQMIGATGLLLGVALAMYRRVDADKKDKYRSMFISTVLAVFLTVLLSHWNSCLCFVHCHCISCMQFFRDVHSQCQESFI